VAKKKKRPSAPPPPVRKAAPRPAAAPARGSARTRRDPGALRRRLGAAVLVAALVAAVAGYVVLDRRRSAELRDTLTAGSCTVDDNTDPTAAAGRNHVQNPRYAVNPPAGGDHLPGAARSGVYAAGAVPADGLLVHSLEHGYVVVWHRPGLAPEQRAELEALEQRHDGDVIVAERASLPVPVAATAWGQRLLCQSVEAAPLERFVEEYVGQGPEDVPRD
jgi:hypothetical protein